MTSKTKSDRWRRLLSHGYFAPELPPCFVSYDLARFRRTIFQGISSLPLVNQRPDYYRYVSEPSWFYFPRFGKEDRRHAVPNPLSYLFLSKAVAENYVQIRRAAKQSGLSASPPVFDWSGSRAVMRPNVDLRDDFRIDLSSRREEYIAADIRAFFHSIYTHSIPWAIHGKSWAKGRGNRGVEHLGNLLDLLSRNLQDGQTIGLPVGPDTSRLLAEVVASAIDNELKLHLGVSAKDASRYIDDYTISSASGQTGEMMVAALRQSAAKFELELNNDKTSLMSTSARQDAGWKQAIRAYIPRGGADAQAILRFFYEVGRMCEGHPELNIEKFAFSNARSVFLGTDSWPNVQNLLINAYRRNPTLVSLLVEIFVLRQVERGDLDRDNLRDFLEHRIPALARANRSGELVWFLFLAIRLQIALSQKAVESICYIDNSMIALLVAVAKSRQLVVGEVDFSRWNIWCDAEGLKSPMWLYAYQVALQQIVPGVTSHFLQQDTYFSQLYRRKVSFLDLQQGFGSFATTLRTLRNENDRTRRVRSDFLEDFDVDIEDYDDDDYEDEVDFNGGY